MAKNHSGALVTIVARATNFSLAAQVNGKRAEDVAKAAIELLKPYQPLVHMLTADNSKEFAYHN